MAIYKSKTPTKDGRQYFFRIKYKDIMNEVHDYTSRKYKTLKEATQEEALYRIKVKNQEICTSNITLEQVFNEYIIEKSKTVKIQTVNKIYDVYKHLNCIKNIKINDFNLEKYKKFYNFVYDLNFSIKHSNKIIGLFRQLIKYSNKYHNTSDSILKYVENIKKTNITKKEMLFFTYEEYKKFDSVIDNIEHHTFFEMLYFLGLRQGECTALNWNDIDFNKKTISITKTLTTKIKDKNWLISSPKTKSSIRELPLTDNLYNDLKTMYNEAIKYNDFNNSWFVFGMIKPFSESSIQLIKNKYCKLANVKQIRIHDFRHSCASLLINKGASIALVSKYLGHSNIAITLNTYTHMYKSELIEMTKIINNL